MNKTYYHVLFWVFIFLYVFDYIIDLYSITQSILYTSFEVAIYCTEFYVNLLLLIPIILVRKGKIAYSIALLFLLSSCFSAYYITGFNKVLSPENFQRAAISFLLNHSLFIFISYIVWFFNKYFDEKQMRMQLENEKLQADMRLLKSQISPHFLFNALNNIYSLVLVKSENAPKMLATLADILRYFLYESDKTTTLLTLEIEAISKYLQIQKYREIAGKENIIFTISNDNSVKEIPPLLLISLVENAFKHGNIIENKNGFVYIDLTITQNKIVFTISNSFQSKVIHEGIGLKNLESQLKNLFGNRYQLNISDTNSTYKVNLSFYEN